MWTYHQSLQLNQALEVLTDFLKKSDFLSLCVAQVPIQGKDTASAVLAGPKDSIICIKNDVQTIYFQDNYQILLTAMRSFSSCLPQSSSKL